MRLGDGANMFFQNHVSALDGSRQFENCFLDVRGEIIEPHDLGHPGRRDLAVVGQFALVDDDPVANKIAAAVGQGQQSRDAWDSALRFARGFSVGERLASVAASLNVERSVDGKFGVHASTSMLPAVKLCKPVLWNMMATLPATPSKSTRSTSS